jgi:uncharacterized OB-fold protein
MTTTFEPADLLARTPLFAPGEPGDATVLHASTCPECGRTAFPRTARCLACGATTDLAHLAGPATLDMLTSVTSQPPGALVTAPYQVGVARFAGAGICVIGLVTGPAAIGDRVYLVIHEHCPDGRTFAFRSIEKEKP